MTDMKDTIFRRSLAGPDEILAAITILPHRSVDQPLICSQALFDRMPDEFRKLLQVYRVGNKMT